MKTANREQLNRPNAVTSVRIKPWRSLSDLANSTLIRGPLIVTNILLV